MKRALIISPHFPPVNAPDHQRVRMMLPYFSENGWVVEVLAVDPGWVRAPQDESLSATVPEGIPIHWVRGFPPSWAQRLGFDNLALRSFRALDRRGEELLTNGRFDLIFFSTTQHGVLPLARKWKERFAVPFVIDIQDPLVNDYYERTQTRPPGGKWKFALSQAAGRRIEREVLPAAVHCVTVSGAYGEDIARRIPAMAQRTFVLSPFPYSERDMRLAEDREPVLGWELTSGAIRLLSAGRSGRDLEFALRAFLLALRAQARESDQQMEAWFIGTRYGELIEPAIQPMAEEVGVAQWVHERPQRQPYLEVLKAQEQADVNLVFGSQDTRYNASKLMGVLAGERPVFAILHEASPAAAAMRRLCPDGLVTFTSTTTTEVLSGRIREKLFQNSYWKAKPAVDREALKHFEARPSTARLCQLWDQSSE